MRMSAAFDALPETQPELLMTPTEIKALQQSDISIFLQKDQYKATIKDKNKVSTLLSKMGTDIDGFSKRVLSQAGRTADIVSLLEKRAAKLQEKMDRANQLRVYIPMTPDDISQRPDLEDELDYIYDSYATYNTGMTELAYRIQEAKAFASRMQDRNNELLVARQYINELLVIVRYIEGL